MTSRTSAARASSLAAAVDDAERVLAPPSAHDPHALQRAADHLRARLEEVLERDADALATDAALQALVVRARAAHARVRAAESAVERAPAAPAAPRAEMSAERARATVDRLNLRRCRECDGTVVLVRDDVTLATRDGAWLVAAVVCGHCGDVRLRMREPEALQRALVDAGWERLTLPGGGGPFRAG